MQYKTPKELAIVYLRNWRDGSNADFWAYNEVYRLIKVDPDLCWSVFLEMVSLADSKEALCYIAAGPLEDLLTGYGIRYIEQVRAQAEADPKFLYCLANVWLETTDEAHLPVLSILADCDIHSSEDAEALIQ